MNPSRTDPGEEPVEGSAAGSPKGADGGPATPSADAGGAGAAADEAQLEEEVADWEEVDSAHESKPVQFHCPNCGAAMTWDPAVDAMHCEYCDQVVKVPRGEGTILERPLEAAADVPHGLGRAVRVTRCRDCGASVTFEGASTSEVCVYCGSSSVLSQEANRNAIRPESLVPLDLSRDQVRDRFRQWTRRLWFRPNALKKARDYDAVGVYVPFWTYDCQVHSDWSADSGTYYWVTVPTTVMVGGRPRIQMQRQRRTRWTPAWGNREDFHDDVLVPASQGLSGERLAKLGHFDVEGLVPYRPEYLAGWRAEEYGVDLKAGWGTALHEVEDVQRSRCGSDVPGDTFRDLRVRNVVSDVRWKHILLPVWSLQYRLRGKTYTVLVHGQTGRVVGDAPISAVKVGLLVGAIALLVLVFLFGSFLLSALAALLAFFGIHVG